MLVDPLGKVVAEADESESIIYGRIGQTHAVEPKTLLMNFPRPECDRGNAEEHPRHNPAPI